MIELEVSRSGQPVLKMNGRYLASSFDPVKEAFGWANRAAADIGTKGAAIILGAGCGYHVAALKEKCPNVSILALELNEQVAHRALEWNPILQAHNLLVVDDLSQMTEAPQLRDAMAGTYAVLPHLPSTDAHPEWALATARFLLGRDRLSFLLQLRMRPDLHSLMDPKKISGLEDAPVSIKTLQKLFSESSAFTRERQVWKVLEELVL